MLTLKKYVGYKYTLNHEIVNMVLSKRQASDCDVKCHILFFSGSIVYTVPHYGWKTRFIFTTTIVRIEPQSNVGDSHLVLLDNFAVHMNFLYRHTCYHWSLLCSLLRNHYKHMLKSHSLSAQSSPFASFM